MRWRDRWFGRLPEIDFVLDGWRRWAYWAAVMSLGITIGIRGGHPGVDLLPFGIGPRPMSAERAVWMADQFLLVSIALIVVVAGRRAFVGSED